MQMPKSYLELRLNQTLGVEHENFHFLEASKVIFMRTTEQEIRRLVTRPLHSPGKSESLMESTRALAVRQEGGRGALNRYNPRDWINYQKGSWKRWRQREDEMGTF